MAVKASVRPSGEMVGFSSEVALSGGLTTNSISGASGGVSRKYATARAIKATARALAVIQPHGLCLAAGMGFCDAVLVPPSASQRSWLARSRGDCHRSSGCLARHLSITRTTPDGVPSGSGGASVLAIAAMTSAAESPRNGRSPRISSCNKTPKLKMSLRPSTACARTCSGDM